MFVVQFCVVYHVKNIKFQYIHVKFVNNISSRSLKFHKVRVTQSGVVEKKIIYPIRYNYSQVQNDRQYNGNA